MRNSQTVDNVTFSYKYDVLAETKNKKYAKKETKNKVKVLAVRFTNETDRPLTIGEDLLLYSGNTMITPMDPEAVVMSLKQNVPIYLLYLLLTPTNLYIQDGNRTQIYPIGLALGPGIAAGNMIGAGGANRNFQAEMVTHDIVGKVVQPGETFSGLIGIHDEGYNPLTIKLKEH